MRVLIAAALAAMLATTGASAQQAAGGVAPQPFTCAAAPTGNMPNAVLEWPPEFYYAGTAPAPKPIALRWCSLPANEAGYTYTAAPWTFCAKEKGTCTPPSFPAVVLYTSGNPSTRRKPPLRTQSLPPKVVSAPIACTNAAMGGDPWRGVVKSCWFRTFELEPVPFAGGPQAGRGYQVGGYFFVR